MPRTVNTLGHPHCDYGAFLLQGTYQLVVSPVAQSQGRAAIIKKESVKAMLIFFLEINQSK
jgi:hypothetical protein